MPFPVDRCEMLSRKEAVELVESLYGGNQRVSVSVENWQEGCSKEVGDIDPGTGQHYCVTVPSFRRKIKVIFEVTGGKE